MDVTIADRPAFAHLRANMNTGDTIIAESDAMASMDGGIVAQARLNGGLFGAIGRRVFGKESLFVNHFTAEQAGELVLTQPLPGDIECLTLNDTTLYLQPGAFLACESTVNLGLGWAGLSSWIGGEGLFRMRVSGRGQIWFGGYGGVYAREIGDEYVVDTGHLIAYEPAIGLKVGLAGGIFSSFFGGEGLVTKVRGPGRIYLQSRSFDGLAAWTNGHLW